MSLDNTLWITGIMAEVAVVGLLVYRRVWRTFPAFSIYCAWVLLSDAGNVVVERFFFDSYTTIYLVETLVDSVLEFGVLVELAWSVLRPMRASLSRKALLVVVVLLVAIGAAIWPFTGIHGLAGVPSALRSLVRVQQIVSVLRILFFLVLAGCSQLLSIGWRDRELQVATGLGFYSLISIAVEVLHSHQGIGPQYHYLQQIVGASYLCSLSYWVFSFAQKEAERREFTPQMQTMLLAVAGTARGARISLTNSASARTGKQEKR